MKADRLFLASRIATCAPGTRPRSGKDARDAGVILDGALATKHGRVAWVGRRDEVAVIEADEVVDFSDSCIIPGLVDCHTHPVWGGSRIDEFIARGQGATYLDLHRAGGGILSTVRATRALPFAEALAHTVCVFERMRAHGTTTVEAKSGYGLDIETELRDLRVLRAAANATGMEMVATCLAAHAIPPEFTHNREGYIDLVINEILVRVASERLAAFCDVFCEDGAFDLEESRRILTAARSLGLKLKIHAEEFAYLGGARMAGELGAVSADHLLSLPQTDFEALRQSGTVAVVLPATTMFLGKTTYAPARGLIDAGVPVAIATDFNAGSCMTESLPAALSIAVLQMGLTPEEALLGATVNAAHALGLGHDRGSLEVGRRADFVVLAMKDPREWLYHFGVNLVASVWSGGQRAGGNHAD